MLPESNSFQSQSSNSDLKEHQYETFKNFKSLKNDKSQTDLEIISSTIFQINSPVTFQFKSIHQTISQLNGSSIISNTLHSTLERIDSLITQFEKVINKSEIQGLDHVLAQKIHNLLNDLTLAQSEEELSLFLGAHLSMKEELAAVTAKVQNAADWFSFSNKIS